MVKNKINADSLEQFLATVGKLNFVKVDGDRFIADNGARLGLQYKLDTHFGLSGVQLVLGLWATSDGGHCGTWGSESDAMNKEIAIWWMKKEAAINEAEYKTADRAAEALINHLNG